MIGLDAPKTLVSRKYMCHTTWLQGNPFNRIVHKKLPELPMRARIVTFQYIVIPRAMKDSYA